MSFLRRRKARELRERTAALAKNDVAFEPTSQTASWKTLQHTQKKLSSLTKRTMALFALSVLMTMVVLVVIVMFMWRSQIRAYSEASVETIGQSVSETLGLAYAETHSWSSSAVTITRSLSTQLDDMKICVFDADGNVVYNDFDPPESAYSEEHRPNKIVRDADIVIDNRIVGRLLIQGTVAGTFSPENYALFWGNTARAFWIVFACGILFTLVIGYFTSRWVVRPIRRISLTVAAIRNGDHTARTGLSGSNDIAQLGETLDAMAATLERTISAEHRLTSDVAHELRTPLMAILVNVEGMQDGVLPADDEHLSLVTSEVRRLSRLVDALLALSRLENNTQQLALETQSMGPLVRELVAAQKPLFKSQGLTLMYAQNASDAQLMARVDQDMLKRALTNVLSNALRYTNEGGRVSVTLGRSGSDVTIAVADTGIGLSKADLEHVFSRFWRSDASRDRVSGGLGIGLSLVKEIVDKHDGYITVESEFGVGSVFTLHIPVVSTSQDSGRLFTIDTLEENQ